MNRLLFYLLIFLFVSTSSGQSPKLIENPSKKYVIKGHVYDSTTIIGLESVSVFVKNHMNHICLTNKNGYFELKLPIKYAKKNFSIVFAYVGYERCTLKVENKKEILNTELKIYLHQQTIDENEEIIIGYHSN